MIEVNEYVRTNKGNIGKVVEIRLGFNKDTQLYQNVYMLDNGLWTILEYIVNHSKQLIDLIGCGDIVNKELVIGIIDITNDKEEIIGKKLITQYRSAQFTGLDIKHYIYANGIKTILTKEQFEANCYKVGGEDE